MSINRGGFIQTNTGLEIDKDPEAELTYTFEWSDWLDDGDGIASVDYSVVARRNDSSAITVESSGVSGTKTYAVLSGGQADKQYTVTAKITTNDGAVDRRAYRVNVKNRQA